MGFLWQLKGGGTFTQADLAGTWYIQAIADSPSANNPYWVSGTMLIDSTGAVIGGTAINSFGETKSFTGGSFTIDSSGQFSGSFMLSDGQAGSVPHGKLDAGKTILTMVASDRLIVGFLWQPRVEWRVRVLVTLLRMAMWTEATWRR